MHRPQFEVAAAPVNGAIAPRKMRLVPPSLSIPEISAISTPVNQTYQAGG
jgi:hypothetical protein